MTKSVPHSTFTTANYCTKEKVEVYKESIGVVFDTKISHQTTSFEAQIHSFQLNEIMFIDCSTQEQFFERSRAKIARDCLDHILIQTFIEGDTTRVETSEQLCCSNGSLIVIDTSRPWRAFNKKFRNLTLVVPRRLFKGKIPSEDILHGMILDSKSNPFASLLLSHIHSIQENITRITSEYTHSLVAPSVDMVCAAICFNPSESTASYTPDKNVALVFKIKNYIEANLSNPQMGIPLILMGFNLTKSTLYRLFPNLNGGIMNYVKERRLIKAFRALSMKDGANKSISQISYESGFESKSSFSRAFKRFFKQSPRDVLKNPQQLTSFDGSSPDRLWESWFRSL